MNYLKLNTNVKSIIVNYLNISSKIKYKKILNHFKYIKNICPGKSTTIENKFIDEFYYIINNDLTPIDIKINNNYIINIFSEILEDELFIIYIEFKYYNWKITRKRIKQIHVDTENNKKILLNILKYIEMFFVCKHCLYFAHDGNLYLELCQDCIREGYNNNEIYKESIINKCIKENKICVSCNKMISEEHLCNLHCDHYFHIDCIKNIETYSYKFNEFCKCPKCNTYCKFICINGIEFYFDSDNFKLYNKLENFNHIKPSTLQIQCNELLDLHKEEYIPYFDEKINY